MPRFISDAAVAELCQAGDTVVHPALVAAVLGPSLTWDIAQSAAGRDIPAWAVAAIATGTAVPEVGRKLRSRTLAPVNVRAALNEFRTVLGRRLAQPTPVPTTKAGRRTAKRAAKHAAAQARVDAASIKTEQFLAAHPAPVPVAAVIEAFPALGPLYQQHQYCGRLPSSFGRQDIQNLFIYQHRRLADRVYDNPVFQPASFADVLHISCSDVTAVKRAEQRALDHNLLDQLAKLAAEQPEQFARRVAAAHTRVAEIKVEQQVKQAAAAARAVAAAQAAQIRREQTPQWRRQLGLCDTKAAQSDWVGSTDVAAVLQLTVAQVRRTIYNRILPARQMYASRYQFAVDLELLVELAAHPPEWVLQARQRRRSAPPALSLSSNQRAQQRREQARQQLEQVMLAVRVRLPFRTGGLETVEAHLGPTNSGKTHDALQFLAQQRSGGYAAPLRMIANEAYDRLSVELGTETVGLITGEEQINPDAPMLCTTAECAPMQGDTLVLDEVHWVADPDRGWAWARLLAGAQVKHLRICGALESRGLLERIFGSQLVVHEHSRLTPLRFDGRIDINAIAPGSLVVAFSRKAVYHLANVIAERTNCNVGALYGAMPPAARRQIIRQFSDGQLDVLVVTDVIGHGINLAASSVIIAETEKYDGHERRPLYPWEAAQIVGRAGRFGLSDQGTVYVLQPYSSYRPDGRLIEQATNIAAGRQPSGLRVRRGELRPRLSDLGCEDPNRLALHLQAWDQQAAASLKGHKWLHRRPVRPLLTRLKLFPASLQRRLGLEQLWQLAMLPVDNPDRLVSYAHALVGGKMVVLPEPQQLQDINIEWAEEVAAAARDAMAFKRAFGDRARINVDPAVTEQIATKRILELLPQAIQNCQFGWCSNCGRPCPPWYSQCDSCFRPRRYRFDDDEDWDDEDEDEY